MTNDDEMMRLAERIEQAPDLTCPLCGETGFDAPGISQHWFRWCEVERAINDGSIPKNNAEVAAALRARISETKKDRDNGDCR
jgi:hypothetical protein